jgi:HSP20 family protein
MSNISIYDPLSEKFNRFFTQFPWHGSLVDPQDSLSKMSIKLDVAEDGKSYLVHADLPGIKKEDVRVDVDGNQVSISAEVKKSKEDKKDKNVIHTERYEGKVFRSFTLDCDIDEAGATAKYADGVLELTLPKKADTNGAKRIAIQ